MAHFLEHLVFKGGEKYDDYRKVNETAEHMGAVLNAYTSHDLVAFHITCRAEVAGEAIDLLTDFVGRPKIDAEELDRERGVVIQEIARAQRPAVGRRRAPDRPRRVRRPPARPPRARPGGAPAQLHARRDRRLPRAPVGGLARRRVPGRQPRARARRRRAGRGVRPLPVDPGQRRLRAGAGVRAADAGRGARLQPVAPAHVLPPADRPARPRASARRWRLLDAAGRLDGLAPVRRDPRAARPRLLGLLGRPRVRRRADPAAVGRARVRQVPSRPTTACARSSTSCARTGRREDEFERARAYAAGRRVLAFENTNAVARYAADADRRLRPGHRPRRARSPSLDETTLERVREVARGISARRSGGLRRAARGRPSSPSNHPD